MKTLKTIAMRLPILVLLCCSFHTALAQEKRELLCKTWKLKKVLVDGDRNSSILINDHLLFSKNMQYKSFDTSDKVGQYVIGGAWSLDKSGQFIIQNPGTDKEKKLRVVQLDDKNLVYQLDMQKSVWEVHMKVEN